ncbi:MAG: coproporphyrinogen dehydrogenase HemZ [Eubacteriales bacterium]|nr:coproporphyrinogen dehydrogenase HemZ [Eubacteriales bacterium]
MDIHILYEGIEAEEMTGETKTPVVPAETMQEKRKRQNDEEPEVQAVFSVRYEAESVRFFYEKLPAAEASIIEENAPAGEMLLPEEAYALSGPVTDWEDRIRTKNEVKAVVYKALTEMTGKQMPWGDLTGIRPTKIPMKVLDDGGSREEAEKLLKETYFVSEEKTQLALDTAVLEKSLLDTIETETGYSLYVGIPFCPSICLYCSFGSHRLEQWKKMVDPYLQTMYKELRFIADEMQDRHLDTIYIGGGTPTSITAEQLDELLGVLDDTFPLRELREFTVEAGRPDTITEDKLRVLRKYPVTRISINPQTMNQKTLDLIGRGHTVEETIEKFRLARKLGFDNINMDLIVGLPGEGEEEVLHTLEEVRKLDPDSLTVHSLALKRATRLNLFKDQYRPVSFENSARIMDKTMECARAMGMNPYYLYRQKNMAGNFENVGYARPGKEGLYNILIMEEKQSILAAGSGASTKFVFDGGKRIERAENVKDLRNYIDRIDEMLERKKKGIDLYLKPQGGCSAG